MNRRRLITGLVALVAAPAIVRADTLMKITGDRYFVWEWTAPILPNIGPQWEQAYKAGIPFSEYAKPWLSPRGNIYRGTWTFFGKTRNIYGDQEIAFRKDEIFHSKEMTAPAEHCPT